MLSHPLFDQLGLLRRRLKALRFYRGDLLRLGVVCKADVLAHIVVVILIIRLALHIPGRQALSALLLGRIIAKHVFYSIILQAIVLGVYLLGMLVRTPDRVRPHPQ